MIIFQINTVQCDSPLRRDEMALLGKREMKSELVQRKMAAETVSYASKEVIESKKELSFDNGHYGKFN